ncbi:MAG: hypothetical protein KCHDKBKB_01622 [Elusimicrobia bacterium]|nr:hypothetical protein [Elusimicrobiota bacterium]
MAKPRERNRRTVKTMGRLASIPVQAVVLAELGGSQDRDPVCVYGRLHSFVHHHICRHDC